MNEEYVQNEELETTTEVVTEVLETGESESEVIASDEAERESQGEKEGQGKPQSKSRNQKARLRRKLDESESARAKQEEEYQQRISALEAKIEGVVNPPAPRPDRVNFDSEEQYEDELHDWRTNKPVVEKAQPVESQPAQGYQNTPEQQEVIDNWKDSIEDAIDKYDDFDELVNQNNSLPISPIMGEAIMESDVGTEVVYYLAKNPKVAKGIANLSIVKQISEINELSKKFTKKTSSAPDPIETVGKGQAASSGKKRHASLEGATFE